MKIRAEFLVLTAGLLVAAAASGRGVDLLGVYPTTLSSGDAVPERARAWEFTTSDVFELSKFNFAVGKEFHLEVGPADLGIGHSQDGAVWALVVPRGEAKLTSTAAKEPETIAHIWLRFHPKVINGLFPADTVAKGGASDLLAGIRTVANSKMRASWQAGGRALIPEPQDLTVDVDTGGGSRRFFVVDTAVPKAEYVDAFADQPVSLERRQPGNAADSASNGISIEKAPAVVVKTVPSAGSMDVDPGLVELRVTFSKTMQDGSWSWTTLSEDTFPEIVGKIHYLADGRTCVAPVKLEPGKFYATWLNSDSCHNFRDAQGQPAVPYLFSFKTAKKGVPAANKGAVSAPTAMGKH